VYIDHEGAEPVEWIDTAAVRAALVANMP
jgi:hypothetical protein